MDVRPLGMSALVVALSGILGSTAAARELPAHA